MTEEFIINGHVMDFHELEDTELEDIEIEIGEQVVKHTFTISVIKNSKADKELMKVHKNPNKYKVEINVMEKKQ